MCRRLSGLDAGHMDRDQPPAVTQHSMTATMTRQLYPGAEQDAAGQGVLGRAPGHEVTVQGLPAGHYGALLPDGWGFPQSRQAGRHSYRHPVRSAPWLS